MSSELIDNGLTFESLDAKRIALEGDFPSNVALRARRCLSWLGRAEKEMAAGDHDAAFVFYWIAFNAAYAKDETGSLEENARTRFGDYFEQVIKLDSDQLIYDAIWRRFSDPIRNLLNNRYVYAPFWHHHNGLPGYENWEEGFARSRSAAHGALGRQDSKTVLSILFDRLYVLRNQLLHGGATWNGSLNREQVGDGARIMAFLVPLFINLMMDNPTSDWGPAHYPPVE